MIGLELLKGIGLGALAGAGSAAIGYLRKKPLDEFDAVVFMRTVLMGAFLGGVASSAGLVDIDTLEELGLMTLVTAGVDRVSVLLYRRVVVPVYEKVKKFFGY